MQHRLLASFFTLLLASFLVYFGGGSEESVKPEPKPDMVESEDSDLEDSDSDLEDSDSDLEDSDSDLEDSDSDLEDSDSDLEDSEELSESTPSEETKSMNANDLSTEESMLENAILAEESKESADPVTVLDQENNPDTLEDRFDNEDNAMEAQDLVELNQNEDLQLSQKSDMEKDEDSLMENIQVLEDSKEGDIENIAEQSSEEKSPKLNYESAAYVIKKGDSLSKIALKYYGSYEYWKILYQKNKDVVGRNPNRIYPKQEILIPKISDKQ